MWDIVNKAADIIGVLTAIFALFTLLQTRQIKRSMEQEKARLSRKINVTLQHGTNKIELPVELRRSELTRAEILGRIGMIPMRIKGQKYSIAYLNTPEFFRQIAQLDEGIGEGVLTIPCTQEEFNQFDL